MVVDSKNGVKGYKVFDKNWTCKGEQFYCPGLFIEEGRVNPGVHGIYFYKDIIDCYDYLFCDSEYHVTEVISYGTVVEQRDVYWTDRLKTVREISRAEALQIVKRLKKNIESPNCGKHSSVHHNIGSYNIGNYNIGNYNSGSSNIGDYNTGDYSNGDWNTASYSMGCFNTIEREIYLFNKPSNWTRDDWIYSDARALLATVIWENRSAQTWWDKLSDYERDIIRKIPNFDPEVFCEIMKIKIGTVERIEDIERIKLKPCPFCGGEPTLFHDKDYSVVSCLDCKASSETFYSDRSWGEMETAKAAVKLWNTRTNGDVK